MNDFWFALMIVLMYFFSVTDSVSTAVGIWHGLKEGNPIFQKILGSKLFNFFFVTPFGIFLSCALQMAVTVGFYKLAEHLDHNHNADAWVPGIIAAGFLAMTIRNIVMIRRTKTK